MGFHDDRTRFQAELDAFYATYPVDVSALLAQMSAASAAHPLWSPFRRKALIYETAAAAAEVQVFRYCPFYFELKAGRQRKQWGFSGLGGWLKDEPEGREYQRAGAEWKRLWQSFVAFNGSTDTDLDHHCVGYDNVLRLGLTGIAQQTRDRLATPCTDTERDFLESILVGMDALTAIAAKFARRAEDMLAREDDPAVRDRLQRLAATARRVPAEPAQTFYEALNTLIFMREVLGSLEGIGVSTFGQMDRMLGPYLEADLAASRLTRAEASDLLLAFLDITDVKFLTKQGHNETSTTVFIGGCDATGAPVFNEVTRLILAAYKELRLANPKFQARLSPDHPEEYFDLLADFIGAGTNVMAIYNDPVVIAANVRAGKALEDARLYVGGGCQENILQNTEISSRATMFFSLAAILEMGFFPERWQEFARSERLVLRPFSEAADFPGFYAAFLHNLQVVVTRLIENRNRLEKDGWRFNPCPLLSATINDCIVKAKDMTAGGCRYSTGSVDLAGIGTLIDSLFAVRKAVFEQHCVSFAQLRDMLAQNFEHEDAFRTYLIGRLSKFGRDDGDIQEFAAQVFADVARVTSGQPNSRGGVYGASLFSHTTSVSHGLRAGATPDGRKAGEPLSKSMGPSVTGLGERHDIGSVFRALAALDLTDYPVVAVLDLKLPAVRPPEAVRLLKPILHRFLEAGGSVLQINTLDAATLRGIRERPESHPDVIVRVSGFSAYFGTLAPAQQDEIIRRTEMQVG